MREVPAALAARAFSDANVARHEAGLTLRVRRDGAGLALVDEARGPSSPAARARADEVLRPHRDRLLLVAEALTEDPTDWSFKLSPTLRARVLDARPGSSPDAASVLINLAAPATAELPPWTSTPRPSPPRSSPRRCPSRGCSNWPAWRTRSRCSPRPR
jgi:hypothetical protein